MKNVTPYLLHDAAIAAIAVAVALLFVFKVIPL